MKLIEHDTYIGLVCPDDLPYEQVIKYQLPFIGDFVFAQGSYDLVDAENIFEEKRKNIKTNWTFDKFLIK